MKNVLFTLCFLIGVHFVLRATCNEFYAMVKVNETECLKCNLSNVFFASLDNEITKKVLFRELSNDAVERYLDTNFPIDKCKSEIIISDSLYNMYNDKVLSEFYLIKDDKVLFECGMREVWDNSDSIEELIREESPIYLQSKFDFLSARLFFENEKIVVFDIVQQTISIFDLKGKLQLYIDSESFNISTLLNRIPSFSDSVYLKAKTYLGKFNQDNIRFSSIYLNEDKIYIAARVPNPELQLLENNDTKLVLDRAPLIISVDLNNLEEDVELYSFNEISLPSNYLVNLQSFSFKNDIAIFPLAKKEVDSLDNKSFGYFRFKNDILVFDYFSSNNLPKLFTENNYENPYFNTQPVIGNNYTYYNYTNNIFLFNDSITVETPFNNKSFFVDIKNMKIEKDFYVHDILVDEKRYSIHIIYSNAQGETFWAYKDISAKEYITKQISINDFDSLKGFIKFKDSNEIVYILNNNRLCTILLN